MDSEFLSFPNCQFQFMLLCFCCHKLVQKRKQNISLFIHRSIVCVWSIFLYSKHIDKVYNASTQGIIGNYLVRVNVAHFTTHHAHSGGNIKPAVLHYWPRTITNHVLQIVIETVCTWEQNRETLLTKTQNNFIHRETHPNMYSLGEEALSGGFQNFERIRMEQALDKVKRDIPFSLQPQSPLELHLIPTEKTTIQNEPYISLCIRSHRPFLGPLSKFIHMPIKLKG